MRRVLVESPYAGDIQRNTLYARRALADSLSRGEAPLASHLLYTQPGVLREEVLSERFKGIMAGLEWLSAADAMILYTDYGVSEGMQNAEKEALRIGIPVEHRTIGPNPEEVSNAKRKSEGEESSQETEACYEEEEESVPQKYRTGGLANAS